MRRRRRIHCADSRRWRVVRSGRRLGQRQGGADGVCDGLLLALVHEAGSEEVLDVEECSVFIGEVGGEPGDVPVLVDDQTSAKKTPNSHGAVVSTVFFHAWIVQEVLFFRD